MKKSLPPRSLLVSAVMVLLAIAQLPSRADEVTVSGSSTGTVVGVSQLAFTGNPFTATTALGVGSFSGLNSLGSFFLNTDTLQSASGSFTLDLTLTAPTGITGGGATTFDATITGSVSPNIDQGGVFIDFTSPSQVFTFSNATATGSFSLTVADLFVQSGRSASITAGLTGQQTAIPEPGTLALLGVGIATAAVMVRRRG
jgi:hypothetical protein